MVVAPGKYSYIRCSEYDTMMVNSVRSSMGIPDYVHNDMINRQLKHCKDQGMMIEEAKAHLLKTYIDDINGMMSQEVIESLRKQMEYHDNRYNRKP